MAKTRIEIPSVWVHPGVQFIHVLASEADTDFDFHAIALGNSPMFQPWDGYFNVTWPPDNWPDFPDPTAEQLEMVAELIRHPYLICDCCPWCNSRPGVPGRPRWNLPRGHQYQYGYPACPYNGSWDPVEWSPDYWPPEYPPV